MKITVFVSPSPHSLSLHPWLPNHINPHQANTDNLQQGLPDVPFILLAVTMRYSGTNVSVPRQCTTAVQLSHFQLSPILPTVFPPSLLAQLKCFSFNDPLFFTNM